MQIKGTRLTDENALRCDIMPQALSIRVF